MALHYYVSPKATELKNQFIKNYKNSTHNIFKKDIIITQTQGLNEWLANSVSEKLGIFAQYEFIETNAFINSLGNQFKIYLNQGSIQTIKWHLYHLLDKNEFKNEFKEVANYYANDAVKRVQLADKVANLFDSYTVLREPFLIDWKQNKVVPSSSENPNFIKHEAWQRWLWIALKNNLQDKSQTELIDSIVFKQKLLNTLKDSPITTYNSISLFGITSISPYNLEILNTLAMHTDINYYLITPSKNINWIDNLNEGNSFLRSCKALGSDLFRNTIAKVSPSQITYLESKEPPQKKALQKIQQDLYHNIENVSEKIHKDDSLQFVSSYTQVREIEALYSYLLHQFEKNKELTPKDILIQITDIDTYEPYISAVFDNAPVSIPYTICNTKAVNKYTISNAIKLLLSLPAENFKADMVLNLLDFASIRKRFGIDDIESVKTLIKLATIRFGESGNTKDESHLVSWQHGLKRLILGTAIKGDHFINYEEENVLLCDVAEDQKALLVYRIKAFVDTVLTLCKMQQEEKSIDAWVNFIQDNVLPDLFELDHDTEDEISNIKTKLHQLRFIDTNNTELISFEVFEQLALINLAGTLSHSRYITGKITFASMQPTRTIPYKIHAILGLNGNIFPRQKMDLGFNLMDLEPKIGDKNARQADQYLFLEALLSAKENLYLSYIGTSVQNNNSLPPSILVEELQSYVKQKFGQDYLTAITTEHPIHTFSSLYNKKDPKLYSYLNSNIKQEENKIETEKTQEKEWNLIDISELAQFFNQPIKWYYNKTLEIYYNSNEEQIDNTELFELNTLQNWSLKNQLIEPFDDLESYGKKLKATGELPLSNMGAIVLDNALNSIRSLKEKVELYKEKEISKTIYEDLKIKNTTLTGSFNQLFKDTQLFFNLSKKDIKPKYKIVAWIHHLFLIATNNAKDTIILAPEDEINYPQKTVSKKEATLILEKLITLFISGQNKPYLYTPEGLYDLENDISIPKILKDLNYQGTTNYNKDYLDPYIEKVLEQPDIDLLIEGQKQVLLEIKTSIFNL